VRDFYEIEAVNNGWSARQLERQMHSFLFERLAKSRDKQGLLALVSEGQVLARPHDAIKDPYVLEFLNLPESHRLVESRIEEALINQLQSFVLELGSGFAFLGRQRRLTLDGDHFYPDLVFYHVKLKCYVVIDLKVGKLTHGDLGQMQLYVHYYDREVTGPGDNPTIGCCCAAKRTTRWCATCSVTRASRYLRAATSSPCPARTPCAQKFSASSNSGSKRLPKRRAKRACPVRRASQQMRVKPSSE